jgi:protein-S-isoprenylcysteine O-methyltransferase Ste14
MQTQTEAIARVRRSYLLLQRTQNLLASWLLMAITFAVYSQVPYLHADLTNHYRLVGLEFTGREALTISALGYAALLFIFYFTEPRPRISKSAYCLRAVKTYLRAPLAAWRDGLPPAERLGLLSTLVKAFFAPLMVVWLVGHTVHMVDNGTYVFADIAKLRTDFMQVFNAHGFWFLLQLIIFLDVFFFTIGYLIELPWLGNEIRSVDPTWLGWTVALLCYPPFNQVTAALVGWQSSDFPQFDQPSVSLALNLLLLALMAVYSSASVALNFKASNLTHRGIVAWGPYALVRHPAYVCKNMAWWIGALPALQAAFHISVWKGALTAASVAGWSTIYVLRALTEEDHLRRVDGEYDQYCARVRYRFIPGIL